MELDQQHTQFFYLRGGNMEFVYYQDTWIMDSLTHQWSPGPKMNKKRHSMGCIIMKSPAHSGREVVLVAGGSSAEIVHYVIDREDTRFSIEILDYTVSNTWEFGKWNPRLTECFLFNFQ